VYETQTKNVKDTLEFLKNLEERLQKLKQNQITRVNEIMRMIEAYRKKLVYEGYL
jgi:hypothetical protein